MNAQHAPERLVFDEAVQEACQRYAHSNGSSAAIVSAVLRAAGHAELLEALCSFVESARCSRLTHREQIESAEVAIAKATGSAA